MFITTMHQLLNSGVFAKEQVRPNGVSHALVTFDQTLNHAFPDLHFAARASPPLGH